MDELDKFEPTIICVRDSERDAYGVRMVSEGVTARMLIELSLERLPHVRNTLMYKIEEFKSGKGGVLFLTLKPIATEGVH